jgi:cytochrome b561
MDLEPDYNPALLKSRDGALQNTLERYGAVAKFFHWTLFLLVIGMLTYGFLLKDIPKPYQPFAANIHKLIGVLILLLTLARLGWASRYPVRLLQQAPIWQRRLERAVHFLLYVALIAMPLSGWIGSSAANRAPHLGNLHFTLPIPQNRAIVSWCFQVHDYLAFVILGLISLHVLAALYHHYIKKDQVLIRMMPERWR